MLDRAKSAARRVLKAALNALKPDDGAAPEPRVVNIARLEIKIGADTEAGQVARDVARQLEQMRRYRGASPKAN